MKHTFEGIYLDIRPYDSGFLRDKSMGFITHGNKAGNFQGATWHWRGGNSHVVVTVLCVASPPERDVYQQKFVTSSGWWDSTYFE